MSNSTEKLGYIMAKLEDVDTKLNTIKADVDLLKADLDRRSSLQKFTTWLIGILSPLAVWALVHLFGWNR